MLREYTWLLKIPLRKCDRIHARFIGFSAFLVVKEKDIFQSYLVPMEIRYDLLE